LKPIQLLDQGEIVRIKIRSFCAGAVNENVAGRMAHAAKTILFKHFPADKVEYIVKENKEGADTAHGDGAGIVIVAVTSTGCLLGGSALGDRAKRAETVGEEAANDLVKHFFHGGCLDEHAQDQVIIFMALAAGKSKVRVGPISMHTQTSIHYTQLMTGAQFTITKIPKTEHRWAGKEDSNWIECQGIGFKNQYLK
jgi:RNA 3'-terminal phosphate cyclase (ATP)